MVYHLIWDEPISLNMIVYVGSYYLLTKMTMTGIRKMYSWVCLNEGNYMIAKPDYERRLVLSESYTHNAVT